MLVVVDFTMISEYLVQNKFGKIVQPLGETIAPLETVMHLNLYLCQSDHLAMH